MREPAPPCGSSPGRSPPGPDSSADVGAAIPRAPASRTALRRTRAASPAAETAWYLPAPPPARTIGFARSAGLPAPLSRRRLPLPPPVSILRERPKDVRIDVANVAPAADNSPRSLHAGRDDAPACLYACSPEGRSDATDA